MLTLIFRCSFDGCERVQEFSAPNWSEMFRDVSCAQWNVCQGFIHCDAHTEKDAGDLIEIMAHDQAYRMADRAHRGGGTVNGKPYFSEHDFKAENVYFTDYTACFTQGHTDGFNRYLSDNNLEEL